MTDEFFSIRKFDYKNDSDFVFSSWISSYQNSEFAKNIFLPIYQTNHRDLINKVLFNNNQTNAYIAVNKHDSNQFYGYAVGTADCLHFIYVKKIFRRLGIGTILLKELNLPKRVEYSHYLAPIEHLMRRKEAFYNPYWFFR